MPSLTVRLRTLWGRENDSDLLHLYYYRIQTYLQNHPAVGDIDVPVSGLILQDNITLLLRSTFKIVIASA